MRKSYSIKDLELLSGIKAHTIRAWESRYGLIEPSRSDTNIRYYTDDHLKKILSVSMLIKGGMKIGRVAKMSDEELSSSISGLERLESGYDSRLKKLKLAMLEFDEPAINAIINSCIIRYGIDETLENIIGPFIREIGMLWQTNSIDVSHEHFVTCIVKMKLYSLIENLTPSYTSASSKVLLFLPGDEMHELSLLYLYYYLKKARYKVLYLGQNLPLQYVKEAADKFHPEILVSVCTTHPHLGEAKDYFATLENLFDLNKCRFYFTGHQSGQFVDMDLPKNIDIVPDIAQLKAGLLATQ